MGRSLRAGCVYFLIAFIAGCALAPVRDTLVLLGLDSFTARLVEAPALLLAMYLGAAWAGRSFRVPLRLGYRLAMGAIGMLLLFTAWLLTEFALRGWQAPGSLSDFATSTGWLLGALLALGLAMPALQMRDRLAV